MTTAVAVSGGIDSLVAAHLVKKEHGSIFGIHFQTGYEEKQHPHTDKSPASESRGRETYASRLQALMGSLDIPLKIIDCRREFENRIVNYFLRSYASGRTPNPCVQCNRDIKFGIALKAAARMGATHLATGHYARIRNTGDQCKLLQGRDRQKDQSYFLSMLRPHQLSCALFPLGEMNKDQVREIARQNGLQPLSSRESQDICFVRNRHYADFLESKKGRIFPPGPIVDTQNKRIGTHKGLHRYTIGQRRGIDCPAQSPYYVVDIDPAANRLVVGYKNSLYKETCFIQQVNWLVSKPHGPIEVRARIRYRHAGAEAEIYPLENNRAVIGFKTPQKAITPGQAAVCYRHERVVAAGWIEGA